MEVSLAGGPREETGHQEDHWTERNRMYWNGPFQVTVTGGATWEGGGEGGNHKLAYQSCYLDRFCDKSLQGGSTRSMHPWALGRPKVNGVQITARSGVQEKGLCWFQLSP